MDLNLNVKIQRMALILRNIRYKFTRRKTRSKTLEFKKERFHVVLKRKFSRVQFHLHFDRDLSLPTRGHVAVLKGLVVKKEFRRIRKELGREGLALNAVSLHDFDD
jgi:hypothetical protein